VNDNAAPLTLYPKRLSAIGPFFVSSIIVAIGIWMGPSEEWFGFVGAAFFGLGIPVAIIKLIPGSINFAPTYDRAKLGRAVAKVLGKCEGALPGTYGKSAKELAAILNARLQVARGRTALES
jgi:hypothetical protein